MEVIKVEKDGKIVSKELFEARDGPFSTNAETGWNGDEGSASRKDRTKYKIELIKGRIWTKFTHFFAQLWEFLKNYVTRDKEKRNRTYYEFFLVTIPIFSGYACLFSLQKRVKMIYGIPDDNSWESHIFGVAVSCLYFGNLLFRMGHNFVLFFLSGWFRVVFSICSLFISMLFLSLVLMDILPHFLIFVFLAYGFGGAGVGTYEANALSVATPLKNSRFWAMIAIPFGIISVTVGGFTLIGLHVPPFLIPIIVAFLLVLAFLVFILIIPRGFEKQRPTIMYFLHVLGKFRNWAPSIALYALFFALNMFFVSLFSPGLELYIYPKGNVNFRIINNFTPFKTVPDAFFIATYNIFFFLGDTTGRRVFQSVKSFPPPYFFLIFNFLGAACGISTIPEITVFAGFFIAFGNGSLYVQSCNWIEKVVLDEYHLISFSFWLFVGDLGSTTGSLLISYILLLFKVK